ncbi:uncharacterized protein LOC142349858 isoform X2 [Convolutriloba macropyga]|uniref:uncharacterized protein LOC142349858 isoform X2 n=1 Tax=Convolutriloba macropyga TaxID=536237 RepID=UPI003F51D232
MLSGILDEIGSVDYIRLQNHINMLNEQMIDQREGFAIRERDRKFRYEGEREKESGWSLDEEMEYNIYPNMYHSLRSVCKLSKWGSSLILAFVSCQTGLSLQTWSRTHHLPMVLFPAEPCSSLHSSQGHRSISEMSIVIQTDRSEFYRPTLELVAAMNRHEISVIIDEQMFANIDIGEVASELDGLQKSALMLYNMQEALQLLKSRKFASSEVFALMGSPESCSRFLKSVDPKSPMLRINYNWVISCQFYNISQLQLPPTMMANVYAVTPVVSSNQDTPVSHLNNNNNLDATIDSVISTTVQVIREHSSEFEPNRVGEIECNSNALYKYGMVLTHNIRQRLLVDAGSKGRVIDRGIMGDDGGGSGGGGILSRNIYAVYHFHIGQRTWRQLGFWNRPDGLSVKVLSHIASGQTSKSANLRVVTVVEHPFVFKHTSKDEGLSTPGVTSQYSGYCIDLFDLIMDKVNQQRRSDQMDPIGYSIYDVTEYGALKEGDGEGGSNRWTGAVGEIVYDNADVAVSGMIITSGRQDVVDFSSRYMDYSVSIIMATSKDTENGFGFLDPLDPHVWTCFLVLIVVVGVLLRVVSSISPSADSVNLLSGQSDRGTFNTHNSIWFMVSSIMMQGVDVQPRTLSGRLLGSFWWFFSLTVTAMYMANLAAFLTVNRMAMPVDSLQSLANQNKFKFGTVKNSPVHQDFEDQAQMIGLYERVSMAFSRGGRDGEDDESWLVNSPREGYERVAKGNYAFMWDDAILQWITSQHCEYVTVGKPFMNKGYGFAISKRSALKADISSAILKLQEERKLDQLKQKWFLNSSSQCSSQHRKDMPKMQHAFSKGECPTEKKIIHVTKYDLFFVWCEFLNFSLTRAWKGLRRRKSFAQFRSFT